MLSAHFCTSYNLIILRPFESQKRTNLQIICKNYRNILKIADLQAQRRCELEVIFMNNIWNWKRVKLMPAIPSAFRMGDSQFKYEYLGGSRPERFGNCCPRATIGFTYLRI